MKERDLTLHQMNIKMIDVMNRLKKLIPELTKLEGEYNGKYHKLMLQGGEPTQAQRESSAKLQLRMSTEKGKPSLFERYSEAKLSVRILLTKKELLFEISRNLRAIR